MEPTPTFAGLVDASGALMLEDCRGFQRAVRRLKGHEVEVTIRRRRTKRSLDQNAYWWAVPVRLLAEHCGYDEPQMHAALLGACFGYTVGPTGHEVPNKPSSAHLTVDEFSRLIDWVLIWAPSELGVDIPAPDTVAA